MVKGCPTRAGCSGGERSALPALLPVLQRAAFFLSLALLPEAFSGNQIFIKTPAFLTSITGPLGSQDVLEARYLISKLSKLWPRVAAALWRLQEQSCCSNRFPGA